MYSHTAYRHNHTLFILSTYVRTILATDKRPLRQCLVSVLPNFHLKIIHYLYHYLPFFLSLSLFRSQTWYDSFVDTMKSAFDFSLFLDNKFAFFNLSTLFLFIW